MSKLPRTRDLPEVEEGYDPARVEEAFATFAERVQELESVASELREELHSLRAERAVPARPAGDRTRFDNEVWPVERPAVALSPDWVGAVPSPVVRGLAVPRLALEGIFLILVAVFAGLADLSVAWIVVVMAAAWALVALAEWAAAAKSSRWRLDDVAPQAGAGQAADATGPWDMPVVQATVVEAGPDPESQTIVTKLPVESVEPEAAEVEPAPEVAPKRRFGLRRRKPAEPGAADPWEA